MTAAYDTEFVTDGEAVLCHPHIAIVTPVFNRRRYTVAFSNMLLAQDYLNFTLYFVDSGSTDGTAEEIVGMNHPSIKLVRVPSYFYWTGATNAGVKRALQDGADYVLTLNDDVIVPRDYLRQITDSAQRSPQAIIGSLILYANRPDTIWGLGAYNDWSRGIFVQTGLAGSSGTRWSTLEPLIRSEFLCGNGTMVPAKIFQRVGLYDQAHLPHYHADSEFTMRAKRLDIDRFVSTRARVYNRFEDASDGAFAPKNTRFFSVRSANYAKAIFFLINANCPVDQRFSNALLYYLPHFKSATYCLRSRLLRASILLFASQSLANTSAYLLLSPTHVDLAVCQDLTLIIQLESRNFAVAAYTMLLLRRPSVSEVDMVVGAVQGGASKAKILVEILTSPEFRAVGSFCASEEKLAAIEGSTKASKSALTGLTKEQQIIFTHLQNTGLLPTSRQLGTELARDIDQDFSSRTVSPSPSCQGLVRRHIYVNVDVLCMAVNDPRAKTGIHRYVSAILDRLMNASPAGVRVFSSEMFDAVWEQLIWQKPELEQIRISNLNKEDPGIVFFPYLPSGSVDLLRERHKIVMTVSDLLPLTNSEWFTSEANIAFSRQAKFLLSADHLFCISNYTRSQLRLHLPQKYEASSVVRLGVDPTFTNRKVARPSKSLRSSPYFLCVGTIEPRKNLVNVIRAFHHLMADEAFAKFELKVVGQQGWGDVSGEAGASSRIHLLGRVDDVQLASLYKGAQSTLFPSLAEGFGFPIVESIACGTPVITSAHASMGEVGGKACFFADPLDPLDIARAMKLSTAKNARSTVDMMAVSSNYTWENSLEDHMAIFRRLADIVG